MSDNIHVAIRVRPLIEREIRESCQVLWQVQGSNQICQLDKKGNLQSYASPFVYDRVFPSTSNNREVYQNMCHSIVESVVDGFHGTIFAYGQTSSGKTFTMMGNQNDPGIIMHAVEDIFRMHKERPDRQFLFRVSYMELYNEKILDLISNHSNMVIKENLQGDVFVSDLEEVTVKSVENVFQVMEKGERNRHFGDTAMNEHSSRSHTIFKMVVESRLRALGEDSPVQVSCLNLVDLAGSEKAGQMGTTGSRFREGVHINKSLLTLSQVICNLSEGKFVNYRDSKITRILQNSLGGNSRTVIICNVTPTSIEQTQSTLNFAIRAKRIQNKPVVNEVLSEAAQIRLHQRQIASLKEQMKQKETIIQELKKTRTNSFSEEHSSTSQNVKRANRRETWGGKQLGGGTTSLVRNEEVETWKSSTMIKASDLCAIVEEDEASPVSADHTAPVRSRSGSSEDLMFAGRFVTTRRKRGTVSFPDNRLTDKDTFEKSSFLEEPPDVFLQNSPDKEMLKKEIEDLTGRNTKLESVIKSLETEYQELQEYTIVERQICLDGTVFGEGVSFLLETPKPAGSSLLRYSFGCQTDFSEFPREALDVSTSADIPSVAPISTEQLSAHQHCEIATQVELSERSDAVSLEEKGILCKLTFKDLSDSQTQTEDVRLKGLCDSQTQTYVDIKPVACDTQIQTETATKPVVFDTQIQTETKSVSDSQVQAKPVFSDSLIQTEIKPVVSDSHVQTETEIKPVVSDSQIQTETEIKLVTHDSQTQVTISVAHCDTQTYTDKVQVVHDLYTQTDDNEGFGNVERSILLLPKSCQTDRCLCCESETQTEQLWLKPTTQKTTASQTFILRSVVETQTDVFVDRVDSTSQTEQMDLANVTVQTDTAQSIAVSCQTSMASLRDNDTQTKLVIHSSVTCQTEPEEPVPCVQCTRLLSVVNLDVSMQTTLKEICDTSCQPDLDQDDRLNKSCQVSVSEQENKRSDSSLTIEELEEEIQHWKNVHQGALEWGEKCEKKIKDLEELLETKDLEIKELGNQNNGGVNLSEEVSSLQSKVSELEAALQVENQKLNVQKNDWFEIQSKCRILEKLNKELKDKVQFHQTKAQEAANKLRRLENQRMDNTMVHLKNEPEALSEAKQPDLNKVGEENIYPGLGCAGYIRIASLERELSAMKRKYNKLLHAYRSCSNSSASTKDDSLEQSASAQHRKGFPGRAEDDEQRKTTPSTTIIPATTEEVAQEPRPSAMAASFTSHKVHISPKANSSIPVHDNKAPKFISAPARDPVPMAPTLISAPARDPVPMAPTFISPPARDPVPVLDFSMEVDKILQSRGSSHLPTGVPDGCSQQ